MDGKNSEQTCFVIMGFHDKTDPNSQRTLDLDKSYRILIKPAVEAAGLRCERADEIQHAGIIDVPMYDRLLQADLVIADLSTWNVNAFFELGVRYALRPRTTIVVAESDFRNPFDSNHIAVRRYEHLGKGIDAEEAKRFTSELTDACRRILASGKTDSPVYTFLGDLLPPARTSAAERTAASERVETPDERRHRTEDKLAHADTNAEKAALSSPLAPLMEEALRARETGHFSRMRDILVH